ncbi:MAG TPA: cell division protein ZapA [Bacteroidia bacterium]|jgi:cell division protein ZapA (FtsZ GTPase activity inhibitor)|nr:cell division protein ZapA [Bacteroidia bacterium]
MNDTSVTIAIAGLTYHLKINKSEQDIIQQAVSFINNHISEFEKQYPVKEKRDVLAMVSLQLTAELLKKQNQQQAEILRLQTLLDELNAMVENHKQKIQG